jgi:hypothetical protein
MKTIAALFLACAFILIQGCSKDYELEKTIFYPDPEFPDLPIYSEWGYNTFGAYYDRQVFTSTKDIVPLKVIVKDGITSFRFSGRLGYSKEMTLTFTMNDFQPAIYQDLIALDKKTINLKEPAYGVQIKIDGKVQQMYLLGGKIDFVKAQNLIVDKKPEQVILSGTFEFQIVIDDEPFTISRGRFDQGISYDNFFRF